MRALLTGALGTLKDYLNLIDMLDYCPTIFTNQEEAKSKLIIYLYYSL